MSERDMRVQLRGQSRMSLRSSGLRLGLRSRRYCGRVDNVFTLQDAPDFGKARLDAPLMKRNVPISQYV